MDKTFKYLIDGRVQGVGYRYFALDQALRIGLFGTVRNLPDGRVEVLATGSPAKLSLFEIELDKGPSFGNVTRMIYHSFCVSFF